MEVAALIGAEGEYIYTEFSAIKIIANYAVAFSTKEVAIG